MTSTNLTRLRLTARGIEQSVLVGGPPAGAPVLLIHGNCSSAAYWEPLLRHLPDTRVVAELVTLT